MSLARISQRLAAARQTAGTAEDRKEGVIEDIQSPHISLSSQWQTAASQSDEGPKPLPLEALGSLLFSLSGYTISTTKEYFNISQLDRCPQVLLVVIDNMSTLDLDEKPNLLSGFRENVNRNGLSALVMPALAANQSTGSDLSQVRVDFRKDTSIIKHLLSETTGVRRLKALNGEHPKKNASLGGVDEINLENFDSGTESLEEASLEPIEWNPTQRIKDFQLKFPRRYAAKLNERLGRTDQDAEDEPLRKQPKLDPEQDGETDKRSNGIMSNVTGSVKPESSKKLREVKQMLVEIQRKLKKLRERKPRDEEHQRKMKRKAMNLRSDFRSKKQEYELERAKCIQGPTRPQDVSPLKKNKEKTSNEDLLNLLDSIKAKSDTDLNLTPVGTVIDPGNLDRSKPERFDRTLLLLSTSEMKAQGFILNNKPSRKVYAPVNSKSKLFGVDCEMCLTTNMASELTRVTVVDEDGVVRMDSLVKPRSRIINYLTQFSGITPEMMQGVTTRKEAILEQLEDILPPDGILVGHSLDSDLKALGISHPYCIDTSVCYSVKGSRQKSKLKVLMKTFLGEDIQTAGAAGHSSAEDSYSALKLVLLKLQNDVSFGDVDLKGDLEWNGFDYETAFKEALQVVAKERVEQGPYRNVWVRRNTPTWQSSTHRFRNIGAALEKPNLIAKLGSCQNKDGDYHRKKTELHKLVKERQRQEGAMKEIKDSLNVEQSSKALAWKIVKEAYRRRKHEKRARAQKSEVDEVLLEKLYEVESKKKELLSLNGKASNEKPVAQSLLVLLAKRKFLEQKLSDLKKTTPKEPTANIKTPRSRFAAEEQLRSDLEKLQKQIEETEKMVAKQSSTEGSNDNQEKEEADGDDDSVSSEGESEEIEPKPNADALTEREVIGTLVENESALEQLRQDEEILREELSLAAADLRRTTMEAKVAAKHEHNEILARQILLGLVDASEVFEDDGLLHNFIEYQLFVLRKNEEFQRKRGKNFGTVALDVLYLNMFTAWNSAGKKSVVVAEREVAEANYDGVDIQSPEDGTLSSTVKAARKCLRTHDLVVSHLRYDDVNENEASIESALDLLWERVKPAGVMIVLIEGTYHYKRLGHGFVLLSIKNRVLS